MEYATHKQAVFVIGLHELQVLRKAKQSSVTCDTLAAAFCDAEGVVSVDIMPRGQTINSDLNIQTL